MGGGGMGAHGMNGGGGLGGHGVNGGHGKAPPTTPKFQHSRHFIIIAVIVVVVVVVIVVVIIIIITFLFCETLNYATIKSRIH